MMVWNFALHLKEIEGFSDELAEKLYADCLDATLSSAKCRAKISFDREADTLQEAIRSAVADARKHGLHIDRIEIEEEDLVEMGLAQCQTP